MKIKRFAKVILSCVLAGALFTGCGGDSNTEENSQATIIKIGMITHLNAGEKQMEEYLFKVQERVHAKVMNHIPKFYDSLKLLQMGIESGGVDQISVYQNVADYLIANNDKYEIAKADWIKGLSDNFCFAVRKDDAALKADLDRVIAEMKSDGTLDKLIVEYITNADKKNPPAVEIPMTDGADKIKVGVTGDLPPMDFVTTDGKPAGFNTALLAEIAKRLGWNIEVIDIDSGARAAALASNQIDVIFWTIVPDGDDRPKNIDKPEGVELSAPYFKDSVTHLKLKE